MVSSVPPPGVVKLIDFGLSLQLPIGPGVVLPSCHRGKILFSNLDLHVRFPLLRLFCPLSLSLSHSLSLSLSLSLDNQLVRA